jgi:hypothetical protein
MSDLWVLGGVCPKDKKPYIEVSEGGTLVLQLSSQDARRIAHDLLEQAARAEADAMIYSYCGTLKMTDEAATHVLRGFRDYRAELDAAKLDRG